MSAVARLVRRDPALTPLLCVSPLARPRPPPRKGSPHAAPSYPPRFPPCPPYPQTPALRDDHAQQLGMRAAGLGDERGGRRTDPTDHVFLLVLANSVAVGGGVVGALAFGAHYLRNSVRLSRNPSLRDASTGARGATLEGFRSPRRACARVVGRPGRR